MSQLPLDAAPEAPRKVTMTAADVREALRHRWPDSEYLTIREAPQDSMRQGRKLDLLVISQWLSRGNERDGVEVKVSVSDWRRELKEAAKADWWFRHVHRFWIAVPDTIADKVKPELPPGWGLLSCTAVGSVIKVKAERHDAASFTWNECIGLLRASADAGPSALMHARAMGETLGYQKAEAALARSTVDGRTQRELEALRQEIANFEKASGVELRGFDGGKRIGEAVKLALDWSASPERIRRNVDRTRDELKRALEALDIADAALGEIST